jgi:uncharacterized protein YggT (Ycf19 family)
MMNASEFLTYQAYGFAFAFTLSIIFFILVMLSVASNDIRAYFDKILYKIVDKYFRRNKK